MVPAAVGSVFKPHPLVMAVRRSTCFSALAIQASDVMGACIQEIDQSVATLFNG